MKMFIWNDPFDVTYGNSYCYAVAETVEEAKLIIRSAKTYPYGDGKPGYSAPFELGEPTRVLDLPCAEIVYWQE